MKRKSSYECIALIVLSLTTGFILYRQTTVSTSTPVYATTLPARKTIDMPITARERQLIRDYLANFSTGKSRKSPPAGFARLSASRARLEPGWEKKLAKGEVLSTDLYRECCPLPKELAARLPSSPLGTALVAVDGRVLRIGRMSLEVLDVFDTRM